jgi:hypothetical protein
MDGISTLAIYYTQGFLPVSEILAYQQRLFNGENLMQLIFVEFRHLTFSAGQNHFLSAIMHTQRVNYHKPYCIQPGVDDKISKNRQ